jgi:hypothetical protein
LSESSPLQSPAFSFVPKFCLVYLFSEPHKSNNLTTLALVSPTPLSSLSTGRSVCSLNSCCSLSRCSSRPKSQVLGSSHKISASRNAQGDLPRDSETSRNSVSPSRCCKGFLDTRCQPAKFLANAESLLGCNLDRTTLVPKHRSKQHLSVSSSKSEQSLV